MSTVLARMIQRGLEPLSSLEPLIPPLLAPRADDYVPGPNLWTNAELTTGAEPTATDGNPALQVEGPDPESQAADTARGDPRLLEASAATHAPADVTLTAPDRTGRTDRNPDGSRPSRSRVTSTAPTPPPPHHHELDLGTERHRPGAEPISPSREAASAPGAPGPPGMPGPPGVSGAAGLPGLLDAPDMPDVAVDADTASAGGVVISIGHIEVRAIQEARPPRQQQTPGSVRPPFRPQVRLADFLAGNTGRHGTDRR